MFEHHGVKITWLGHDGFKIQDHGETLVIDPFQLKHDVRADYLLISHEHFDHCNPDDLKRVVEPNTVVLGSKDCKEALSGLNAKEVKILKPGENVHLGTFEIRAVPAYNLNKFREPGKVFHPKEDQKLGYVVKTSGGLTIYHTGDSDLIPEMDDLKPEIALLPVSGTYVMTADEASQAAKMIKPNIAIPMHWGAIVGTREDAEKFSKSAGCRVEILDVE